MKLTLKIFLIILIIIQFFMIVKTVKKRKLSMKYCSLWVILLLGMVIFVVFPNLLFWLSDFFGFETTSNMVFLLGFFFLFYLVFVLTMAISLQNEKTKLLIQEISLLKKQVEDKR